MAEHDRDPADFEAAQAGALASNYLDTVTVVKVRVGVNSDSLDITDTLWDDYFPNATVSESMKACDVVSVMFNAHPMISESIDLQDGIAFVWDELIQEFIDFQDISSFDPNIFVTISETLVLLDIVENSHSGFLFIQDSIKLLDAAIMAWGIKVIEALNIPDVITDNLIFFNTIVETLAATTNVLNQLSFLVTVSDNADISDSTSIQQMLNIDISEIFGFTGGLSFGDDYYTFVLNTENEAISLYSNYNFNSISGELAASDTGIYQLTGDDDEGTLIGASLKTALMDFGNNLHKQVPYTYIGFSSDGELILKAISNQNGVKKERWYHCKPSRDADATSRVQLGRGVKSKYWQFEIINVDGADFDIESFEPMPLSLKRRI